MVHRFMRHIGFLILILIMGTAWGAEFSMLKRALGGGVLVSFCSFVSLFAENHGVMVWIAVVVLILVLVVVATSRVAMDLTYRADAASVPFGAR
ncbi:MAG: hypothetical protein AAF563_10690 [Pseudomonadota bacterium]